MKNYPKTISPCPILEAMVEIKFDTNFPKGAIFGLIYTKYKDLYSVVTPLPLTQIPEEIRDNDPNLKYKPLYKLTDGKFIIQVGSDVITFHSPVEYVGWEEFSTKIFEFINLFETTGVYFKIIDFSLRYMNFFEFDITSKINLSIELIGNKHSSSNVMFRTEFEKEGVVNVLQIANQVSVTKNGINKNGSLIDIICLVQNPISFFSMKENFLNRLHDAEHSLFFGLLRDDFLKELNATY